MSRMWSDVVCSAVTLEGTIIHKSGLMTGGRSTHNTGKKWEEKDFQGANNYDSSCEPVPTDVFS